MKKAIELGIIPGQGAMGRPSRADAVANRELLLATAERLFAQEGVENVTMAHIAEEAGVGKGTLYRRFSSKAELCLALMDTQMNDFQNRTLEHLRRLDETGESTLAQLDVFLDALVHFTEAHSPLLCEVQSAGLLPGGVRGQMPHFWQHMTVSALLRKAIAGDEMPAGLDVAYTADALLATLRADLFRYQREARGFSLERISAGLRALCRGLSVA